MPVIGEAPLVAKDAVHCHVVIVIHGGVTRRHIVDVIRRTLHARPPGTG
jgi:hypothetical protein